MMEVVPHGDADKPLPSPHDGLGDVRQVMQDATEDGRAGSPGDNGHRMGKARPDDKEGVQHPKRKEVPDKAVLPARPVLVREEPPRWIVRHVVGHVGAVPPAAWHVDPAVEPVSDEVDEDGRGQEPQDCRNHF